MTKNLKKSGLAALLLLGLAYLFASCTESKSNLVIGQWQSLNDPNLSIEFDENGSQILLRLKQSRTSYVEGDTALIMKSQYVVKGTYRQRLQILNPPGYGDDAAILSEVEFLDENRIILYVYKHHGILDLADEFARTPSPYKFDSIMGEIMLTPDLTLE